MGRLDRALGSFYGLAIGDAIGAPATFLSPQQIRSAYGKIEGFNAPVAGIHAGLRAASVTDDTRIAIAKARAIVREGRLSVSAIAREVSKEAERIAKEGASLLGPSTSRAVRLISSGLSPWFTGIGGSTNGCAMSVAPVAIYGWASPPSELFELVELSCIPTHCHFGAVLGAFMVAMSIKGCLSGMKCSESIEESVSVARSIRPLRCHGDSLNVVKRYELAKRAYRAEGPEGLYKFYIEKEGALTEDAVPAALAIAGDSDAFEEAVLSAANAGGDADTVAAIAGAVKGSEVGLSGINPEWVSRIRRSVRIIGRLTPLLLKLGGLR